jgi:UDP-2,3-diacylglucosamine hydrolase
LTERNKIYFLSDLHLKLDRSRKTIKAKRRFLDFLDYAKNDALEIVLAGDIFDFWYEWISVIPSFHFEIFFKLRQMIETGIKVTYIAGNHDFNLGSYLQNEVGINCIADDHVFEYGGKKFFVSHGDGLAESDGGYRILKKILRSKISNFLFRTFIPPDLGIYIAKLTSKSSRTYRHIDRSKWKEEYFDFAKRKIGEGYDIVVLGHLHLPELRTSGNGTYLNAGDWMKYFSYGVYCNGKLTLENFDEKKTE